jgi:hypothetical protein
MQPNNTSLPEWMWHKQFKCVVRILKTGHFPSTVMVQLPDDSIVEVEVELLETHE